MELLAKLRLEGFADSYPSQLSQGMRQRGGHRPHAGHQSRPVAHGRAVRSALDAQTRLTVQAEFLELWYETHKTVIFVTHDLDEAVLLADRVIVMTARPGRIKSDTIVDLPRPRVIDELRFDPAFREIEHKIWEELRGEIV